MKNSIPNDQKPSIQDIVDRIQKHWLVVIVGGAVALTGATWTVAKEVLVSPRDSRIADLQKQVEELRARPQPVASPQPHGSEPIVLPETGIFEGASATTTDGLCQVRVDHVSGELVNLSVLIGSDEPQHYEHLRPGDRVTARANVAVYFIDLHRTRGDIVDLSVAKLALPKQPGQ